ncbi:MAG: hypothetical protein ABEJ61_05945 [Haloferacaceae archaeon]
MTGGDGARASRFDRLYRAPTFPLLSLRTTAAAVAVGAATYAVLVASADPTAAGRALAFGPGTVDDLLVTFTVGTYRTAGALGLALTVAYAALGGVLAVVVAAGIGRGAGTANLVGVAPGVLAAGCASCGAGALSILGVAGAYSLFPFAGNLVRVAGILLVLVALHRMGDPRRCDWN